MSLTTVLEIGKSGLGVYQTAIDTTSQNIANVNTTGYSRQQVVLETAPTTTDYGFLLGSGVKIAAIQRYYDNLLQQQLITAQSTEGNDTTKSTVLQQIQPTFNEVTTDGLGAAVSNFFGAWQDLTLNAAGSAERQTVLSRAQILVDNFHAVSSTLNSTIATQDKSLPPLTADISAKLKNIAQLNDQIKNTQLVGGNTNELKDQQEQLLRDLSKQVGIVTSEPNPADGTVIVKLSTNLTGGGQTLVDGSNYATMYTDNAGGTTTNSIYLTAAGNPPPVTNPATDTNITATVGGPNNPANPADNSLGVLGATLGLRDTIIPGYLAQVNALANQIVTQVNTLHNNATNPLGAYDVNGTAGGDFFGAGVTAATISLNITDANKIAASSTAAAHAGSSNATAIANIQNTAFAFATGSATLSSYYDSLVSKVGLDVKSAENTATQDTAYTKQLSTLRESNSGVSLDEELTNLVKYQRSYQASAKLITTASEMMDTVLGLIH